MNVLVLGCGGREHALCWRLSQDKSSSEVYAIPGNDGMTHDGISTYDISLENFEGLYQFVQDKNIALIIVGSEKPLEQGVVDFFQNKKIPIVGSTQAASRLETSKSYAKAIMQKYKIPTSGYRVFSNASLAKDYVDLLEKEEVVIKASSLASGKGVFVCDTKSEAKNAIYDLLENSNFKIKTKEIVVEQRVYGEELSAFALFDQNTFKVMGFAKDYKNLLDNNLGPNTGGMGSYSSDLLISSELEKKISDEVFTPIMKGMKNEGTAFTGILFVGLMITEDQLNVIEFNVRLGDPETQVLLPRVEEDLTSVFYAQATNTLDSQKFKLSQNSSVHVVMTSKNYPGLGTDQIDIGHEIILSKTTEEKIFFAGVKEVNEKIINYGGRVLGVTSLAPDLYGAREKAYRVISEINFKGAHYRKDIGLEA